MKNISIQHLYGMKGVFSLEFIPAGTVVINLADEGKVVNSPTRTSIQIGEQYHIEHSTGAFINHDCNPTCRVDGAILLSIIDIGKDDEITFDYNKNESMTSSPFICRCCGKNIRGRKYENQ